MNTVLITGAAGFAGGHLIELLAHEDAEIVGWKRPGTEPLVSTPRVRWVVVEMHDAGAVAAAVKAANPSAVYHLAGAAHVGDSWQRIGETFAGNVLATQHLFEGLRGAALQPRVLVTGSAMIYKPIDHLINERDEIAPNSPYATSKLAQEMLAQRAWEDDGLPVLIARAFNHVGPRQAPSFVAPAIACQIAAIEAGKMPPVLRMGNLAPKRDIMDVRDTVRAYRAMMEAARPGVPYNVCAGKPVAIQELVDLFRSRARVPITVEQDPSKFRPNDTPLLAGDATQLTTDTGWSAQIPLQQTVDDLLDYWRRCG